MQSTLIIKNKSNKITMLKVTVKGKQGSVASYKPDTEIGYYVWMDGHTSPIFCMKRDVIFSERDIIHHEIKLMLDRNAHDLKSIEQRNMLISELRSSCDHEWNWLNDPRYESLHECDICGETRALDIRIVRKHK